MFHKEDHPYHASKHCSQAPHIERVIVFLEVNKQLGAFEVARGNTDVVLSARVVELSQTPVDQTELRKMKQVVES